jgi:hypothetical protein
MGLVRDNLLQLFSESKTCLRKLVLDLESPTFEPLIETIPDHIKQALNEAQQTCISKIISG